MHEIVSFKDWIMLHEGSFTEKDIPPYFYVGCYFSEDFVKHYPFTPKDSVCTLVGLEGITENSSTASSLGGGGAALRMPGKAVVQQNKISKGMYSNPHYMASAGFRTPRRLKSGSDPLGAAQKSYTSESITQQVIGSILPNIGTAIATEAKRKLRQYMQDLNGGNASVKDLQFAVEGARALGYDVKDIEKAMSEKKHTQTAQHGSSTGNDDFKALLDNMAYHLDYNVGYNPSLKALDGSNIDTDAIVDMLKKLKPIKANIFTGEERPEYRQWGVGNVKPLRSRHKDNQLKSLKSADDLAGRLQVVMRGLLGDVANVLRQPGHDSTTQYYLVNDEDGYLVKGGKWLKTSGTLPSNLMIWDDLDSAQAAADKYKERTKRDIRVADRQTPIPQLAAWLRDASKNTGAGYSGEGEWIMKRVMLSGVQGKKCPSCKKFNRIEDPDNVPSSMNCWSCGTPIDLSKLDQGARPVLNVPEGSDLYINANRQEHGDWFRKYLPSDMQHANQIDKTKWIVEHFKLHKKFNVHLVTSGSVSDSIGTSARPYDPNRGEMLQKIKDAIQKGINRKDMLEKYLIFKEMPQELNDNLKTAQRSGDGKAIRQAEMQIDAFKKQIKANLRITLDRWEKGGLIKIEDGIIKLQHADFDEDTLAVYDCIRNHEGITKTSIQSQTGITGQDLDKALQTLISQDKIQLLNSGKYDIKLSPEEMNQMDDVEVATLEAVKTQNVTDIYSLQSAVKNAYDSMSLRRALRTLTLKNRIFKSQFSGAYRVTISENEPLTKEEQTVISYLKKWPHSDLFSLRKALKKMGVTELNKALDGLVSRKLVVVTPEHEVLLNKDKFKDLAADTKSHSHGADAIFKTLENHFFTHYSEVAKMKKWEMYETESYFTKLMNKGIIKKDNNYRFIPANFSGQKETYEERLVKAYAAKKEWFTSEQVGKILQKKMPYYRSTSYLLESLVNKGVIKKAYHPIEAKDYYHDASKKFEIDTKKWEDKVADAIKKLGKPSDIETIRNEIDDDGSYISYDATSHILTTMKNKGTVKEETNFAGNVLYHLPDMEGPKQAQAYFEPVMKILQAEGPLTQGQMLQKTSETTGLDYNETEALLRIMAGYDDNSGDYVPEKGVIDREYNNFLDEEVYKLKDQTSPSVADYAEKALQFVSQKPAKMTDVRTHLGIREYSAKKVLAYLVNEGKIKETQDFQGYKIYSLPNIDPLAEAMAALETKINQMISDKGGTMKCSDILSKLYNYPPYIYNEKAIEILKDMIKKGVLHVQAGDMDDESEFWHSYGVLSTNYVDPSTVAKNPMIDVIMPHITELFAENPTPKCSDIYYRLENKGLLNQVGSSDGVQRLVKKLLKQNKLAYMDGSSPDVYWSWERKLTLPQTAPAQAATTTPAAQTAASTTGTNTPTGWDKI